MCTTWRHCYGPYNHPHTRHACPCGRLNAFMIRVCRFKYTLVLKFSVLSLLVDQS
ncbi:hypothetical protein L9F63_021019, partial [Diploptera punctata]